MIRHGTAALVLVVLGCATTLPQAFVEERAAAERAYSAGRYDEAAEHWARAERAAERRKDQSEARYRRAAALRRAGRHAQAEQLLEELGRTRPKSARAARAAFDRADIQIEHGDRDRGFAALEAAIRKYPRSGVALAALRRLARHRQEREGTDAALALLGNLAGSGGSAALREQAAFERARLLESQGRDADALAAYLETARKHPYPQGALWDDALFSASLLEERRGRIDLAIEHLERMLREKEPSSLNQGSYQRPRYASARFRVAELYRDSVGDESRAVEEFRRVWSEHPTSLLRDDALWQAARLARGLGRADEACSIAKTLVTEAPDSRFAPCVRALCPTQEPAKGRCHDYVLRALDPAQASD
jgi:tetratricopeptide (TPR) repeat protein